GLDVDVAGAPLQRGEDGSVDQADDGAAVALGGEPLDGDGLVSSLVFADDVEDEALAGFFQYALGLLGLLEDVTDLRARRDFGDDPLAEQQTKLVDHHQPARIGDRHDQTPVVRVVQWDEVVAKHQVHGHRAEKVVLNMEVLQIDELAAVATREVARARLLG